MPTLRKVTRTTGAARLSRRALLARAGAGALAVAAIGGTGVALRIVQQSALRPGTGEAYAAWSAALTGTGSLGLVRAAVLAANAHDSQPWFFHVTDRQIDVFADRTRNIGALDPLFRELEISLGCAIENLVIAARASGLAPVEIPGVGNLYFLRTALNALRRSRGDEELDAIDFLSLAKEKMKLVDLDPAFGSRSLNEGFSGGEKKRNEVFQMAVLEPRLAILDEIDSGLDIDALRV